MSRSALAFLESLSARIPPPETPTKPGIPGVGEVPPERSAEASSKPIVTGKMIVVRSMYWKRIHFCNISCGSPCKVTWKYRSGISVAELNEISAKIGADLKNIGLPGISAEIGSKISSTVTRSNDQEVSTEFTTTAPKNGGVTHARWQLVDRYNLIWSVKKWWSTKIENRIAFIEGNVDAFDESVLLYFRKDCFPDGGESNSWLDKLKRGLQPFIIQGSSHDVVVPGKANPNGSISLEGLSGTYNINDRVPEDSVIDYLRMIGSSDLSRLNQQFYLRSYQGSFDLFIRTASQHSTATRKSGRLISFGTGLAAGAVLGVLYAPRSGRETREAILNSADEGKEYVKNRGREAKETVSQWVDRSKDIVGQQKEKISAAIDATRQAYDEAAGRQGTKKS
jgi:gas vesicle protein